MLLLIPRPATLQKQTAVEIQKSEQKHMTKNAH